MPADHPSDKIGAAIRERYPQARAWLDKVYPDWLLPQMTREQIAWAIAVYYEKDGSDAWD